MEVLDLDIIQSTDSFMDTYSLLNMMDSQSFEEQYQQTQKTEELGGEKDEKFDEKNVTEEEVMNILKDMPDSFWSPWTEETSNAQPKKIILKDIPDSFWSPWLQETANAQPNQKMSNKIRCEKCMRSFTKAWIKKHCCKPIPQKGKKNCLQGERFVFNYECVT